MISLFGSSFLLRARCSAPSMAFRTFNLSLFTAKTLKTLLLADSPCPLVVCCILSLPLSAVDVVPVDLFACLYSNFLFSTLLLSLSSPARSKHFKNYRMYSTSTPFLFLPYFTLLSSRLPTRQTSRRLAPPLPVIRFGYRGFGYVEPTHLSLIHHLHSLPLTIMKYTLLCTPHSPSP